MPANILLTLPNNTWPGPKVIFRIQISWQILLHNCYVETIPPTYNLKSKFHTWTTFLVTTDSYSIFCCSDCIPQPAYTVQQTACLYCSHFVIGSVDRQVSGSGQGARGGRRNRRRNGQGDSLLPVTWSAVLSNQLISCFPAETDNTER